MPKVSIIIPVYKAEKYIEKCARSLFEQTLDDIEYIFVNDCTPDGSISVLRQTMEDYPKRLESVKIIDLPANGGQAKARKIGIEAASGDYIIHCDSDDWVDSDMYRLMYEKAEEDGLDVVICGYYLTDGITSNLWRQCFDTDPISELLLHRLSSSLCNKLVRKEIIFRDDFVYPNDNFCEDFVYNMQFFIYANRIGYVDKELYYYFRHTNNTTNTDNEESLNLHQQQVINNTDLALSILEKHGLYLKYMDDIIHHKLSIKNSNLPYISSRLAQWKSIYSDINCKVFGCQSITRREKILFIITYLHLYPIYKYIKSVLHK